MVGLLAVWLVDLWVGGMAAQRVAETAVSKAAWMVAQLADLMVGERVEPKAVQKVYQMVEATVAL